MTAVNQREFTAEIVGMIRRDRARRSRGKAFRSFLGRLFGALLTGFLTALLNGWLFMLAVGVIHDHWLPRVGPVGYWWSVLICWLLRSALSSTASATTKNGADR